MRLVALLCSLLLVIGQAQARVRAHEDILESGILKVAVYKDFPPYSFETDGKPRGVDVDLAQRLADELGLKVELLWVTPGEKLEDDLRNFIWKGHYMRPGVLADLMLRIPYDREYANRLNDVGEVEQDQVHMFGPYQRERWQVVHDRKRLPKVDTIGVFQYHKIGVELDSVPSFYLTSVLAGRLRANTEHYASIGTAFDAMRAGKVDAVMAMRGELDWLVHQAKDANLLKADNTYPTLGQPYWDIGMAVHESNRQLANSVDGLLEDMIRSGEMAKIYARYGVYYELPGLYQDVE